MKTPTTTATGTSRTQWKISNRLTLNGGIRWEYYGVQHNNNPNLDSNFYLGAGTNLAAADCHRTGPTRAQLPGRRL